MAEGHRLSTFSSRRPVHVLFLAAILKLAGGNLAVASVFLCVLAALAMAALAVSIRRSHDTVTAGTVALLSVLFYRRFVGTGLSEQAGFILGCLAAALLWRGAGTRAPGELYGGTFLLTLALVARAGCFFVLPFVVLWIGWLCRRDRRRTSLRASTSAAAAVGLGFAFNWAALHAFGVPGSAFSNFPMSLYGVISGGDWNTAYADHPEIRAMPEAQAAQRLLSAILARLRDDPWLLVEGSFRAWAAFLGFKGGQFSFLRAGALAQIPEMTRILVPWAHLPTGLERITGALGVHDWPTLVVVGTYSLAPWLLFAVGAAVAAAGARNPRIRLLAACWAGIVASIPFVPPWDADLMRAYAATLPLQFVLCGLGASRAVAWLAARVARRRVEGRPAGSADPIAARTIALATVAALLPVLLVFKVAMWNAAPDPVATHACAAGRPHLALPIAGAEITLADRREGLFRLDVAGFKRSLLLLLKSFPELFRPFMALPPGTTLTAVRYADGFGYGVLAYPADDAFRSWPDEPLPVCVDSPLLIDMSRGPASDARSAEPPAAPPAADRLSRGTP